MSCCCCMHPRCQHLPSRHFDWDVGNVVVNMVSVRNPGAEWIRRRRGGERAQRGEKPCIRSTRASNAWCCWSWLFSLPMSSLRLVSWLMRFVAARTASCSSPRLCFRSSSLGPMCIRAPKHVRTPTPRKSFGKQRGHGPLTEQSRYAPILKVWLVDSGAQRTISTPRT